MKKIGKYQIAFSVLLFILLLYINFLLGTEKIQSAFNDNFNGGRCGACQSCVYIFEICQKKYGFDIYLLIFSLIPVSFLAFLINGMNIKKSLFQSLHVSIIYVLVWLATVEIITSLFKVPVLYTHFMEGRQSLHYKFVPLFPEVILIVSFAVAVFSGFAGFIVSKIFEKILYRK